MNPKLQNLLSCLTCIPCLRRHRKKQRNSTFNIISVTQLQSETAGPAEEARRSMFFNVVAGNETAAENGEVAAIYDARDYDQDAVEVREACLCEGLGEALPGVKEEGEGDGNAEAAVLEAAAAPVSDAISDAAAVAVAAMDMDTSDADSDESAPCEVGEVAGETNPAALVTTDENRQEI